MQRIHAADLPQQVGQQITIHGWVHRRRILKSVAFLIVRDPTGLAQAVVTDPVDRAHLDEFPEETALAVTGVVTDSAAAPAGVELTEPRLRRLGDPAAATPFDLYRPQLAAGLATQLDHAPLALRHPRRAAALRIAAAAVAGFRATLDVAGFVEIHTPKVVASATESGANVFPVDWFGRPAYLAQSPQFYKQLMVGVFDRVYEVGPVFRAEPHDTSRHLAQYTSLDVELGFVTDHQDVIAVLREVLAGVCGAVEGRAAGALATLGVRVAQVPDPLPAVSFTEALTIAGAAPDQLDLTPADERALGAWAVRVHESPFLVVTGYPAAKRPFYTAPDPTDPEGTNSFDLLFNGVELVTGGQRRHRYDDYVAALTGRGEPLAPYESYLAAFRYGIPPHGGFAIGLERLVAALTGAGNVREVTAFPRDLHRLEP